MGRPAQGTRHRIENRAFLARNARFDCNSAIAIQREMDGQQLGRTLLAKPAAFIRSEAHAQALLIHQQASCVGDMAPKYFFLLYSSFVKLSDALRLRLLPTLCSESRIIRRPRAKFRSGFADLYDRDDDRDDCRSTTHPMQKAHLRYSSCRGYPSDTA